MVNSPDKVRQSISLIGQFTAVDEVLTGRWIAVIAGLSAKTMDGASAFSYPLPILPSISSAFVLTSTMPAVVRAFAENQPVTLIINAIRALLSSQSVGNNIWIAIAWCVGIMAVAYFLAMRANNRRVLSRRILLNRSRDGRSATESGAEWIRLTGLYAPPTM